jgi:LuxR family transcriptional regulator
MLLKNPLLAELFGELDALAPMGYSLGLHIRFISAALFKTTYPDIWVRIYCGRAYYPRDPVVVWGIGTTGTCRWSEIPVPDPHGVFAQAAAHGLRFGAASACGPVTSRSVVGIARADREFTDAELAQLTRITRDLHKRAAPPAELSPAQLAALRCLAQGDRNCEAAERLGISESAFKARLTSARKHLSARTTAEALRVAHDYCLL